MAQKDATEQAKEVLRQLIKYRFWISISVAALFAIIAYSIGSGPVRALAATETAKINTAQTNVKKFALPTIPTKEYEPIVVEKTQVLTNDVNKAWKILFDRQAPLLTWPEEVQERFRKWGRQWPVGTAPRTVQLAIVDYIEAYPSYVAMVYKTFNPFNYETGDGVVVAAPEEVLLRPAVFDPDHLPGLGKVWAAQERLWIQRTLLEVVAQVNKNAKTWDSSVIRQIVSLDVGNPAAQDQRSVAKNETLEESQPILAPGETEETAAASPSFGAAKAGSTGRMMAERMRGGLGLGGGGLTAGASSDTVYYVKAAADKGQYKILPVVMTVLIDQDRVQNFLVELESSPMSIQVMDFELERPPTRVVKPEKGTMNTSAYMGYMGGMRRMGDGMMMGMRGMSGFGGGYGAMTRDFMMRRPFGADAMGMGGLGRMGGMGVEDQRKGKDVRGVDRSKQREEKEKAAAEAKGPSFFDPYFDIVQVTVHGQARFFNPPPDSATGAPSPGEASAATTASGSPAGSDVGKGAPAQSPPGTAGRPGQEPSVPKTADGATPSGEDDVQDAKPAPKAADGAAPKAEDDVHDAKPAPKAADTAPPKGEGESQDANPTPNAADGAASKGDDESQDNTPAPKAQPKGGAVKP